MGQCVGTIAALVSSLFLADNEPVVIATDPLPTGYTKLDPSGQIVGFEKDLVDEICVRAKLNCIWETANFDQLIPGVMSGRFDVAVGGIGVTEERRGLISFTHAYFDDDLEQWFIGHPGAPKPSHALIGVQSGTMHESHLRNNGYRFQPYLTEQQTLDALASDEVELVFASRAGSHEMATFFADNGLDYLYPEVVPYDGHAIVVCRGNTELLDLLNLALKSIIDDGTFQTFEERWLQ